jgi:uncharacterized protein (DUF169 family)
MASKEIDLVGLQAEVMSAIKPKGLPVAFKLLKAGEASAIKVPKLEKNLALCQLLKYCAVFEKTRLVEFGNIDACVVGSYVLGFGMPPKDIGDRWIKGFNYTKERFSDLVKNIEALPQGKYSAAVFGPLADFDRVGIKPDGVILIVNSTQSYLLLVGLFDATGKKTVSSFNGHAACEIIATLASGKSPWLTIPCGGARGIAESQDDELWVGMTIDELAKASGRLKSIGLKYPPFVYEMITSDLNKQHPLTALIAREG